MTKYITLLAVTAIPGFFQLQLLMVEAQKWPNIKELISTAQAQIVLRLKQLRLKLTSQQATLLVNKY